MCQRKILMLHEQVLNGHSGPTWQLMPRGDMSLLILTTILRTEHWRPTVPYMLRSVISLRFPASGAVSYLQGSAFHTHLMTTLRRILFALDLKRGHAAAMQADQVRRWNSVWGRSQSWHSTGFSLSLNRAFGKLQMHKGSTCALPSWPHCVHVCAEVRYKAQWNWVPMQILTNHVRNSSSSLPSCFLRVRYPLETNGLSHLLSTAAFNGSQGCLCHGDLARTEAPCS